MNKRVKTDWLKRRALKMGFLDVRIAKAQFMEPEARRLEAWLKKGHHGQMGYMENHFDKRVDPTRLVEGAKTVISLSYNYFTDQQQEDAAAPQIAMYALGEDYHYVIKSKLQELMIAIHEEFGEVNGRCFVDSAPVLERDWARRGGLGWIGKNTLLLSKKRGSYFFLAELITDLDLEVDPEVTDHCGACTRCIDACPTDAIAPQGYILDARKCISYLTIELKEAIPEEFKNKMENWAFGCDICQQVCPWNRFSTPHQETAFGPRAEIVKMQKSEWKELTEETFNKIFKKSAVKRTKFKGLKRNIEFLD